MFIVLLHYKVPLEDIDPYRSAHMEFLKEGYAKNVFIASGRMYSDKGGVILSPLTRRGEFEDILKKDPFMLHGLATYEIIGFDPSLFHSDFSSFIWERDKEKIEMVPYTSQWEALFNKEAEDLRQVFGDTLLTIHHIGSTSIPGIVAKPVVDMLPVVRDLCEVDRLTASVEALGYEAKGEYGMPGRRFFVKSQDGKRLFNVHVFEECHPDVKRHLLFRDYLRTHPEEAFAYADLKKRLVLKYPDDIERYCWGKDDFIKMIEKKALVWHNSQPKECT
ncbi:MAG: GrpB family protein [Proteobacteria bacterium]|nr:GrpB family protein [Pseudomonadota bacterium]